MSGKMKVAGLRAALQALGPPEPEPEPPAPTTKAAGKRRRSSSSAAAAASSASSSASSSSSSSSSSAAAAAPKPEARTGPFAVLPTVLLSEVFGALETYERCAAARASLDFAEAARAAFTGLKRLEIGPKHAGRIDDAALGRLIKLSAAGGALTHVIVCGAGPLVTPAAFEPLKGCKSLETIDIRDSSSLSKAIEKDDVMYSIIDSLIPFVPRRNEKIRGPYQWSQLDLVRISGFNLDDNDAVRLQAPFTEVYVDWAKDVGLEVTGDASAAQFADQPAAQTLWQEGGAEEVHRRIEQIRIQDGTGHASFSFRHFLRDHDQHSEHFSFSTSKDDYGFLLAKQLGGAAYWRARALEQKCDRCETPLVESESMAPIVAAGQEHRITTQCIVCSSTLCKACSGIACEDCSAQICDSPDCRAADDVPEKCGSCSGALRLCPSAFRICDICQDTTTCRDCNTDYSQNVCPGCYEALGWGGEGCDCGTCLGWA